VVDTVDPASNRHPYARIATSESVTEGHPDKLCDLVSDAILDAHLALDPDARVACEPVAAGNAIWVHGEITSSTRVDIEAVVRGVVRDIGYTGTTRPSAAAPSAALAARNRSKAAPRPTASGSAPEKQTESSDSRGFRFESGERTG